MSRISRTSRTREPLHRKLGYWTFIIAAAKQSLYIADAQLALVHRRLFLSPFLSIEPSVRGKQGATPRGRVWNPRGSFAETMRLRYRLVSVSRSLFHSFESVCYNVCAKDGILLE